MKITAHTNYDRGKTGKRFLVCRVLDWTGWPESHIGITFRPWMHHVKIEWWTWQTKEAAFGSARSVKFYLIHSDEQVCYRIVEPLPRSLDTLTDRIPFPGDVARWRELQSIAVAVAAHKCIPGVIADFIQDYMPEPFCALATDTPRRLFEALCPIPLAVGGE